MIENSFGILASQWRIFKKSILTSVENVVKIVQATICLHNFLRKSNINNAGNYGSPELVDREGDIIPGQWRYTVTNGSAFNDFNFCGSNTTILVFPLLSEIIFAIISMKRVQYHGNSYRFINSRFFLIQPSIK